ncbi:MAG: tripartite tricarboxylate transporter substrate binding protein [Spirochaetales bacterium]|jgi:tripartite-type tricarboxylate transporter receptor subunit TctC
MKRIVAFSILLALIVASGFAQGAINYPTKPIELIVPFAAGGGTDAVGRAVAVSLKNILKQEVVVSNKVGGGGSVGMIDALHAKPDGYTIGVVTREVVSLPLMGQAPFKTMDFRYVGMVNFDPPLIVVNSKSKYLTLADLLNDMKKNPDKLKFSATVVPNFYGVPFAKACGVSFITVPNNGAAPAITEVLGGRGDFSICSPGEARAQVEAGNLRPLGIMSESRVPGLFKDVPTLRELGYDVVTGTYRGLGVNPSTPDAIVKILEDALAKVAVDPAFIDFMNKSYIGMLYKNSADMTAYIKKDIDVLKPVIESLK